MGFLSVNEIGMIKDAEKVAFRCSTDFSDNSKARYTANPKLAPQCFGAVPNDRRDAFQAQTLDLPPFRFAKNGYRKNLNSRFKATRPVFQQLVRPTMTGRIPQRG